MSNLLEKIDRGIRWSYYAIFFLTPLILFPKTFELFEFNKMWFVFAAALVILFLWTSKMMVSEKFVFKRTFLDIPIALFLISQILSTVFSIDPHVSFWGYYSRFNGGLLSTITYIFLYYAFVSNFTGTPQGVTRSGGPPSSTRSEARMSDGGAKRQDPELKMLLASLLSGLAVALWGFSSHFGYDLTCLMFRGQFDVSCWTDAFQPTVRLFSTLGQPNWLAAYFSILIPISLSVGIFKVASFLETSPRNFTSKEFLLATCYVLLATFLFIEVLWTASQSGFLGLITGLGVFTVGFILFIFKKSAIKKFELKILIGAVFTFILLAFFIGNPLANRFSFLSVYGFVSSPGKTSVQKQTEAAIPALEGGSDSGKIRTIVWTGAIEIFKRYPIFGSGAETFAYSYYKVKPVEHNLLSEWDYLYNKAHNEYLNYLATTGIIGLGTYLLFIFRFLFSAAKKFLKENDNFTKVIMLGLVSSFITILVSNFFGFSVVMINLYLFMIPALFLTLSSNKTPDISEKNITPIKFIGISIIGMLCLYFLFFLLRYWTADQKYNYGYNLQKVQEYVAARDYLEEAAKLVPSESVYQDELSSNLATFAYLLYSQNQATQAAVFANRATTLSNTLIQDHPQNVTYYKTRVRVFFTLAQVDPKYLDEAIKTVEKAKFLAPTDAKISYNAALLYGQQGNTDKAITELKRALELKPNYRDPRIALATYYKEKADTETDFIKKEEYINLAKKEIEYSLKNIAPDDPQAKELLKSIQ